MKVRRVTEAELPSRVLRRPKYGWGRRSWEVYGELAWLVFLGWGAVMFIDWFRAVWDSTFGF